MRQNHLYYSGRDTQLSDFLAQKYKNAINEANSLDQSDFSRLSEIQLLEALFKKYSVQAPVFKTDEIHVSLKEEQVPVHLHPNSFLFAGNDEGATLPQMYAHVVIPFEGDEEVTEYTPSTYSTELPYGEVWNKTVRFTVPLTQIDAATLDSSVDKKVAVLLRFAGTAKEDADRHNNTLRDALETVIKDRKRGLDDMANKLKNSKYLG